MDCGCDTEEAMTDVCPICEGRGLRVVERPGGSPVAESCECPVGRLAAQILAEAGIPQRTKYRGMNGRRQQLLARYGSEERIPVEQLQAGELLSWFREDFGSYEAIPAAKKDLLERKPADRPFNRETIAEMNAKLPPQTEPKPRPKPVPYVEGIAGMNGKICGLDGSMSEADLMAWWKSEGRKER